MVRTLLSTDLEGRPVRVRTLRLSMLGSGWFVNLQLYKSSQALQNNQARAFSTVVGRSFFELLGLLLADARTSHCRCP